MRSFVRYSGAVAMVCTFAACGSSTPKTGTGLGTGTAGSDSSSPGGDNGGANGQTPGSNSGGASSQTPGHDGAGTQTPGDTGGTTAIASSGGSSATPTGARPVTASDVAKWLGRPAQFLIGMGNDLNNDHSMDGAYTVGTTLDLHYAYLSAYKNSDGSWGSWSSWNAGGTFVNILTDSADAKGVVPMFSLYSMAAWGDGNLAGLSDDKFEKPYWDDVKLLFQRIGVFGKPAVVQLEPDFWGYAEQQSKENPASMKVNVTANAPDCAGLSNDLVGMGRCLLRLARMYAPKAIVGFHASQWANGDPNAMVTFFKAVGADQGDVIFADLLDRDAGCFEAATDPNCMRGGTFYWDETNATKPNFHDYLAWSKTISSGLGKPMIWWQIPFGVPSTTPGGSAGHYRDNRVHYIFSHIAEFIAAGGVGAAFGTGAGNQTYINTDNDQFKNAVAAYAKAPVALP